MFIAESSIINEGNGSENRFVLLFYRHTYTQTVTMAGTETKEEWKEIFMLFYLAIASFYVIRFC